MVGGGPGAGIAETHRIAMRLDDRYVIVAGVFSRTREKSLNAAKKLQISEERIYSNYAAMADAEFKREHNRIDAVVIVTQTASHYEIAGKFLEVGINVICDKPFALLPDRWSPANTGTRRGVAVAGCTQMDACGARASGRFF